MDKDKILEKVIQIIEGHTREPELLKSVTMDNTIIDGLKVNSVRLIDIVIELEEAFDIEIDDDDADQIKTVGDVIGLIEQKLQLAN